jgi:hypothetical protein
MENRAEHGGQHNTFTGGNPNLVPERADTTSVGVVISPYRLSGFHFALDYYDIKLDDTINALNADDIHSAASPAIPSCAPDPSRSVLFAVAHAERLHGVHPGQRRQEEGAGPRPERQLREAGGAALTFSFIGGYLFKAFIDTGLFSYDCAGLTGPICNDPYSDHRAMQPKWRHLFRGSWERGITTVTVGWRMIGSVTAEELSDQQDLQNPDMEDS